MCVVVGSEGDLNYKELAGPFHATLAAYAGQDKDCHHQVFDDISSDIIGFSSYGPFLIMVQVLILIFLDKMVLMIPRMAQRLERFYKSVVEETLMGRDPDVAEDFAGNDVSIERILRIRQREEICGALKSTSSFYKFYLSKNLLQIILGAFFISIDVLYIVDSEDSVGFCIIPLGSDMDSKVTMQCRQKRFDVVHCLMIVYVAFASLAIFFNFASLIWISEYIGGRAITNILKSLGNKEDRYLIKSDGKDFLFLFDLIAHNCGVPATLRVLTYTANKFTEFCKPVIKFDQLNMTETSLSIAWEPPQLQSVDCRQVNYLRLVKYVVTILPKIRDNYKDVAKSDRYVAEFENLEGGTREYIVTVSAIISDAKMKGAIYRTYLPPYPPQNLRVDPEPSAENEGSRLKVSWIKPKGNFDKFHLFVYNISINKNFLQTSLSDNQQMEILISKDENSYIIPNLNPGEAYAVLLQTVSGNQPCLARSTPRQICITQPKPPNETDIKIQHSEDQVDVYWQSPTKIDGHSLLEGYEIELRNTAGNELVKDLLNVHTYRHSFQDLAPGQEYTIGLASICRLRDPENKIKFTNKSIKVFKKFMSLPSPPANLRVEKAETNMLRIRWDPPSCLNCDEVAYALAIELQNAPEEDRYFLERKVEKHSSQSEKKGDNTTIHFINLPVSGALYEVEVRSMIMYNSEALFSDIIRGFFVTKPCPPSELEITDHENQEFIWRKSSTKSVEQYKFKIKTEEKTHDFIVPDQEGEYIKFHLNLDIVEGVEHNINIFSQLFLNEAWHESNSLHLKLVKTESSPAALETDELDGPQQKKLVLINPGSMPVERTISNPADRKTLNKTSCKQKL